MRARHVCKWACGRHYVCAHVVWCIVLAAGQVYGYQRHMAGSGDAPPGSYLHQLKLLQYIFEQAYVGGQTLGRAVPRHTRGAVLPVEGGSGDPLLQGGSCPP